MAKGTQPTPETRIPVKMRTCNCPQALVNGKEFYLEDGIIRTLLEAGNPAWKHVPKKPCDHWELTYMQLPAVGTSTVSEDKSGENAQE